MRKKVVDKLVDYIRRDLRERRKETYYATAKASGLRSEVISKRLGITVFQPRLKVCTFARTNYFEYGKQRQVQEYP